MTSEVAEDRLGWPELPYADWRDTCATLHLWTQVLGKVRLVQTPWLNHSWHVALYLTPRGFTTSPIPYCLRSFEIEFDFIRHVLTISTNEGTRKEIGLFPRSVADFYDEVMQELAGLGFDIRIHETPNEMPMPFPSVRTASTTPMIPSSHGGTSKCCLGLIGSLPPSARASSASAVQCIFSGAASTSQ